MANWHGLGFVSVKKTNLIAVGDVIAFQGHDKKNYCHRVVQLDSEKVTTKGDNFAESKPYEISIPLNKVEGKVVWSWPT